MTSDNDSVLTNIPDDPMELCRAWIVEAGEVGEPIPQSIALATVGSDGRPTQRMMTVRDLDERGFVIFTHAASRKAADLARSPEAAIAFHWPLLNRQVSASGAMTPLDPTTCATAFSRRPHNRQIITLAWNQSEEVADREELHRRFAETETRLGSEPITAPDRWIGYRLVPTSVEFWNGHDHGIDERLEFFRDSPSESWRTRVLAP